MTKSILNNSIPGMYRPVLGKKVRETFEPIVNKIYGKEFPVKVNSNKKISLKKGDEVRHYKTFKSACLDVGLHVSSLSAAVRQGRKAIKGWEIILNNEDFV